MLVYKEQIGPCVSLLFNLLQVYEENRGLILERVYEMCFNLSFLHIYVKN